MGRCAEGERLYNHLVTGTYATSQKCQVYGGSARGESDYVLILTDKGLQIFFEPIDVRSKGHYPVGVKSLLDVLLFHSRLAHVRQT